MSRAILAALLLLVGAMSCDAASKTNVAVNVAAAEFDHHECAACGMIVREQPAPRGQLVHRDGERVFFCSVADMLTYVDVPSAHGKPAAIYVETSSALQDPKAPTTAKQPWAKAETAFYVTGVENPLIMGFPILTYANRESAQGAATSVSGQLHDWSGIRDFSSKRKEK